jgi:hypothetical protein
MSFIKGLVPGTLFTWFLSLIFGRNHTSAGWLEVHMTSLADTHFYWSWPLFLIMTGLAWAIFWMME